MAINTTANMIPISVTAKRERSWARLRQARSQAIASPKAQMRWRADAQGRHRAVRAAPRRSVLGPSLPSPFSPRRRRRRSGYRHPPAARPAERSRRLGRSAPPVPDCLCARRGRPRTTRFATHESTDPHDLAGKAPVPVGVGLDIGILAKTQQCDIGLVHLSAYPQTREIADRENRRIGQLGDLLARAAVSDAARSRRSGCAPIDFSYRRPWPRLVAPGPMPARPRPCVARPARAGAATTAR